jgi:hypothetical protein
MLSRLARASILDTKYARLQDIQMNFETTFQEMKNYMDHLAVMDESKIAKTAQLGRHLRERFEWGVVSQEIWENDIAPRSETPKDSFNINRKAAVNMSNISTLNIHTAWIETLKHLINKREIKNVTMTTRFFNFFSQDQDIIIEDLTVILVLKCIFSQYQIGTKVPSENHLKIELWADILSCTFKSQGYTCVWELNHLIPENARKGSSKSDFAALISDPLQGLIPFFIVEFEVDGIDIHKDSNVVLAEGSFELTQILSKLPKLPSQQLRNIQMHLALINNGQIKLNKLIPCYNKDETAIVYLHSHETRIFDIASSEPSERLKNALNLICYLQEVVCETGSTIQKYLQRSNRTPDLNVEKLLPRLPHEALTSRKSRCQLTPKHKRPKLDD